MPDEKIGDIIKLDEDAVKKLKSQGEYFLDEKGRILQEAVEKVSYGKNMLEKFKKHSQQIREVARKYGIEIPKSPSNIETQKAMQNFIEKVVKEGESKIGDYMTLGKCQWSKLGDGIVIRKMNGEFVTFLKHSLGDVAKQWDKI